MTVKRIVPNISFSDPERSKSFYQEIFGLDLVMDLGWILTFASSEPTRPQISVMSEGGSGTDVPNMSIEVDDVDLVYRNARQFGAEIVYDLTDEDWGVRRFYVLDPSGMILNVLSHL